MADRPTAKPEIASQKRVVKLPPAIGDWTAYRPPKILVKKIKSGLYGFDRLSNEELDRVMVIHYRFIQELLKRLKIDLAMGVEFYSCQVEQTTYLNFLRGLSGPIAQAKIQLPNLHDTIQWYCNLNLANSIINHALGSQDMESMSRGLTEAESTVLATAMTEYLPKLTQAFDNVFADPTFIMVGSPDISLDQSVGTTATFVSFSAELSLNDNPTEKIIFGYPGHMLKLLLKSHAEKERVKPLNFSRLPAALLNKISIPVSAILGKTYLSTNELHYLDSGDVVALDSSINSAINLAIGSLFKLPAQPGTKNRKNAIRIAGFKDDELQIAPPAFENPEEKIEEVPAAPVVEEVPIAEEEKLPEEELELGEDETFLEEEFPEEELGEITLDEEFPEEELKEE